MVVKCVMFNAFFCRSCRNIYNAKAKFLKFMSVMFTNKYNMNGLTGHHNLL